MFTRRYLIFVLYLIILGLFKNMLINAALSFILLVNWVNIWFWTLMMRFDHCLWITMNILLYWLILDFTLMLMISKYMLLLYCIILRIAWRGNSTRLYWLRNQSWFISFTFVQWILLTLLWLGNILWGIFPWLGYLLMPLFINKRGFFWRFFIFQNLSYRLKR